MQTHPFDAIVIGAGIAGASAAAHLAQDRRVALLEARQSSCFVASPALAMSELR